MFSFVERYLVYLFFINFILNTFHQVPSPKSISFIRNMNYSHDTRIPLMIKNMSSMFSFKSSISLLIFLYSIVKSKLFERTKIKYLGLFGRVVLLGESRDNWRSSGIRKTHHVTPPLQIILGTLIWKNQNLINRWYLELKQTF